MTVIESLTLGPKDYGLDTMGTEEWRWTEPNSGINLKRVQYTRQTSYPGEMGLFR